MKNIFRSLVAVLAVAILVTGCKKPTATFTSDKTSVKVGEVVTFTNSSEDAAVYMWDFGDGTQSMQKNPTHVYDTPGKYMVTLTSAKNKNKKPADASPIEITVSAPTSPKADFTASKTAGMPGEVFTFAATDTSAEEFVWDFGDGSMSLSPNATHTYMTGGTYTVSLTVYNYDRKQSDTQTKTITIGNASGDIATEAMLVGKWKITSHMLTNTINGNPVASCNFPQAYSFTFTAANTPVVEATATGTLIMYDLDNNMRGSGSYNVIDKTRMSWSHATLNSSGAQTGSQINGTYVPSSGSAAQVWTITTLSATTLTLTSVYTTTNASVSACVTGQPNVTGKQVITETVTYTKQ
jgi:PKD repeat protein